MVQIPMLKYHFGRADRDTLAAVIAFIFVYNIGAVITPDDGIFRAGLKAFAALGADPGLELARLRETGFYSQARLFGIDLVKMADGADLHAQTATAAFARYNS